MEVAASDAADLTDAIEDLRLTGPLSDLCGLMGESNSQSIAGDAGLTCTGEGSTMNGGGKSSKGVPSEIIVIAWFSACGWNIKSC